VRLFDEYIVVDWSAKNSPATGQDSIWIARLDVHDTITLSNPSTRHEAAHAIDALIGGRGSRRTLLTVDASLGYPSGSAGWFGLDGDPAWSAMWQTIERELVDDERNRSNRFEVAGSLNRRGRHGGDAPFWGRHAATDVDGLTVTKPADFPVPEFRACDLLLRSSGARPASPWQLLGAGSVGSQSLTVIPRLERLRRRWGADVWPFTTGLRPPETAPGAVVVAEIWPTAFDIVLPIHWIRDAAQVDGVARRLANADEGGDLAEWFAPPVGDATNIEQEEGWILGVVPGSESRFWHPDLRSSN
jgi:precorrin-8X/cobalt-precorrin-8 methylmutase